MARGMSWVGIIVEEFSDEHNRHNVYLCITFLLKAIYVWFVYGEFNEVYGCNVIRVGTKVHRNLSTATQTFK